MVRLPLLTLVLMTCFSANVKAWRPWKINHKFCGTTGGHFHGKILHGEQINKKSMPWIVQLEISTEDAIHFCGGSIITSRVVITAAHCLSYVDQIIEEIIVYYNSSIKKGGPTTRGLRYVQHPQFDRTLSINDVAMIQVEEEFRFQNSFLPVCLPNKQRKYTSDYYTIGGWGRTTPDGPSSAHLRRARIRIMKTNQCRQALEHTKLRTVDIESIVCGVTPKEDFCKGDSGGPLTGMKDSMHAELVGIVSSTFGCGDPEYPSIFMRVLYYMPWIKKELRHQQRWIPLDILAPAF